MSCPPELHRCLSVAAYLARQQGLHLHGVVFLGRPTGVFCLLQRYNAPVLVIVFPHAVPSTVALAFTPYVSLSRGSLSTSFQGYLYLPAARFIAPLALFVLLVEIIPAELLYELLGRPVVLGHGFLLAVLPDFLHCDCVVVRGFRSEDVAPVVA